MADAKQNNDGPLGLDVSAPDEERRGALRALVVVGSLAYAGAIAVPAAGFVTSAGAGGAEGKRARWVRACRFDELVPGEPKRWQLVGDERDAFTVAREQVLGTVWIIRDGDQVRALSAVCPHLGCAIEANADKKSFSCPCHASSFALSGVPDAGPSPRPMDPLEARVVDGWVEIDFKRFRLGIAERREV